MKLPTFKSIGTWIIAHDWVAIPLVLLASILLCFIVGLWLNFLVKAFELGWKL